MRFPPGAPSPVHVPRLGRTLLGLGLALLGQLAAGCGPAGAAGTTSASPATDGTAPTVLLVTLDTTRADGLGAYGAPPGTTPRLDALAAGGLVFEQARATNPITLPSHASLLTGTYPTAHGVRDNGIYRVEPESRLVSEALAERGFRTAAFVGAFVLDGRQGLDQGFERYGMPPLRRLGQPLAGAERPADQVVDDALTWLDDVPAAAPVFLWVHLFDAHFPYAPPEPHRSRFEHPYAGEIAFCDEQVGRLLDGLDARGRAGPRLVLVAADHGESLGEHGEEVHGVFVYDATMRVPLIMAGTDVPAGRVTDPVSLADVAPTILDWLGLPRALLPDVHTPSLLATARGAPDGDEPAGAERPIPVESLLPLHQHGWHPLRGLVWRGFKYVDSARPELYDLTADPGETVDLLAERPELAARMAARLSALDAAHPPLDWSRRTSLDPEAARALGSLGYLAGDGDHAVDGQTLPDAKDRLADIRLRDEALLLLWQGRRRMGIDGVLADVPRAPRDEQDAERFRRGREQLAQARDMLTELLQRNAHDAQLTRLLGIVQLALDEPVAARDLFEHAVRLAPRSAEGHFDLAVARQQTGDGDGAFAAMTEALRLQPRAVRATCWMAEWHLARGEPQAAIACLEQLLGAEPVPPDERDPDVLAVLALLARAHALADG